MSRSEFGEIAREHYKRRDYVGAFEALYARVDGDPARVPWADLKPHAALVRWVDEQKVGRPSRPSEGPTGWTPVPRKRAVVVGCGLGDDAHALADFGYDVLGFDISPTAIDWARSRFTHERLRFEVGDLFNLPAGWLGAFDRVVEIYTFQSLPLAVRPAAMDHAASLVCPGGKLLVVCRGREPDEPATKLPFPLLKSELDRYVEAGLIETRFEDYLDDETPPVRRFLAEYHRPAG